MAGNEVVIRVRADGAQQTSSQLNSVVASAKGVGIGLLGAAAASIALRGAFSSTVGAAISFESSFAGIRKTMNLTEAEFARLARANRDLAKTIPVSVNELNRIGELAGQLGIRGVQNVLKFEDTIAKLAVTTNLTSEEAAVSFAQIANVMQLPQEQIDRLGSAVVHLGNNFATTERDIVAFTQRIAGAGQIVGLTVAEVAGIGAAMASVGVEAEAGGTAVQRTLLAIHQAVIETGDQLDILAAVAGMSASEFATAWRDDAAAAFLRFAEGLGGSGEDAIAILDALGLADQRVLRSLLSLSQAGDVARRAIEGGNQAFADNNALQIEAAKRFETTASQLKIVKNNFTDLGITIGTAVLPAVVKVSEFLLYSVNNWVIAITAARNAINSLFGIGAKGAEGPATFREITPEEASRIAGLGPRSELPGGLKSVRVNEKTGEVTETDIGGNVTVIGRVAVSGPVQNMPQPPPPSGGGGGGFGFGGGGGGEAAATAAEATRFSEAMLAMIDGITASLPQFTFDGLAAAQTVKEWTEANAQFSSVTASVNRQIAETALAMADLDAQGLELTPEFQMLEERMAALRDAAARIDLIEELRLNPFADAVKRLGDSMREQEEAAKAAAESTWQMTLRIMQMAAEQKALNGIVPIDPGDVADLVFAAQHGSESAAAALAGLGDRVSIGTVPQLAGGGFIEQTGLAVVHKGEVVTAGGGGVTVNLTVNGTVIAERDLKDNVVRAVLEAQRLGQL